MYLGPQTQSVSQSLAAVAGNDKELPYTALGVTVFFVMLFAASCKVASS